MKTQIIEGLRLTASTTSRGVSRVVVNHGQKQIGHYDSGGWHPTKTKNQQNHPDWVKETFPSIARGPQAQTAIPEEVLAACKKMLAEEIKEDAQRQEKGEWGTQDYTW